MFSMARDKEAVRKYLDENPEDELRDYIRGEAWDMVCRNWLSAPKWGSEVVHHIVRATGTKYDIPSLMVTVDAMTHEWVHKCPKYGVVLCLWYKAMVKDEFDRDQVREVTGRDWIAVIDYWLDNEQLGDPTYRGLAVELTDAYL